MTENTVSYRVF